MKKTLLDQLLEAEKHFRRDMPIIIKEHNNVLYEGRLSDVPFGRVVDYLNKECVYKRLEDLLNNFYLLFNVGTK